MMEDSTRLEVLLRGKKDRDSQKMSGLNEQSSDCLGTT